MSPAQDERHQSIRALYGNVTKQEIVVLVREWFNFHGEPPRRIDWDPLMAIRTGKPEVAEQFYREGAWPLAGTVVSIFGSFTQAVIDAGFYPRMRTKVWIETDTEARAGYLRSAIRALDALNSGRRA